MPDSLSLDVKASINWLHQETLALSTVADASQVDYRGDLDDGSGEDQADTLWHDERTLSNGASEDLDLTDLARTLFGDAASVGFAAIKSLLLVNTATVAGEDLVIGGAGVGAQGWGAPFRDDPDAELLIPAEAVLLLVNKKDGWDVDAGVADQLRITNLGTGSVTYKIVIAGVGA